MQSMQKKQVEYVLCTVLSCEVLIAKAFREERNACARLEHGAEEVGSPSRALKDNNRKRQSHILLIMLCKSA